MSEPEVDRRPRGLLDAFDDEPPKKPVKRGDGSQSKDPKRATKHAAEADDDLDLSRIR